MQRIDIYDVDLNRQVSVFTWVSLLWEESYNDEGSFLLELQQNEYGDAPIGLWRFAVADGHECPMLITSVVSDGKKITLRGYPATFLLKKRASDYVIADTDAETALRTLFGEMSPFPNLSLAPARSLGIRFAAQTSDQSVFNYFVKICQATDIGFKVLKQGDALKLDLYQLDENEDAKFAVKYGNLGAITYTSSKKDYYNVAFVAGAGEGEDRITVIVGDTSSTGYDRHELYVDARDVQPQEGQTEQEYLQALALKGLEALSEAAEIESVSFAISDENVALGEIVTVILDELNVTLKARIAKISTKSQNNKTTRTITVGTPLSQKRIRGD